RATRWPSRNPKSSHGGSSRSPPIEGRGDMEIFFFHLMPWPYIPEDFKSRYRSSWVVLPNSYYDPVAGHRIYREYLAQLAPADELGFDAVCVNEHHQNGYGTMPSPNVIASILCERTK